MCDCLKLTKKNELLSYKHFNSEYALLKIILSLRIIPSSQGAYQGFVPGVMMFLQLPVQFSTHFETIVF